jgi:hypothetical protein
VELKKLKDNKDNDNLLRVAPNPFYGSTMIRIDCRLKNVDCRLKIFNLSGQKAADLKARESLWWNATNQPAGIYIARLNIGKEIIKKQLIILK